MTTTEAAVLYGARDLRLERRDLPEPGPADAVVAMRSGGVCGSDMHYFAHGRNGTNVLRGPTVLGHEAAGVVVSAGPEARVSVGTAVAIEPAGFCGRCQACARGRTNICPEATYYGSPPTDGLYAREAVIPADRLHALPDEVPAEIGAIVEPLAVATWAVERAALDPGARVLVVGAGPIGLLVARVAVARGAGDVVVADTQPVRLDTARQLGFDAAEPDRLGSGWDRVLDCSGAVRALPASIRATVPGGRVVVVGQMPPEADAVPAGHLQRYEIDVVTAFRSVGSFGPALDLVRGGAVQVSDLVTGRFPLEDAAAALMAPTSDPRHLKVLITF